jgi:hypothetical protein
MCAFQESAGSSVRTKPLARRDAMVLIGLPNRVADVVVSEARTISGATEEFQWQLPASIGPEYCVRTPPGTKLVSATNVIYHHAQHPSALILAIVTIR